MSKKFLIKMLLNIGTIIGTAAIVVFLIYGIYSGVLTSADALQKFIVKVGIWGPLVFVFVQIIQVVLPIIPGAFGCAAGVMIFGPVYGFIYNYVGICLGSVFAFLIARRYGMSIIRSFFSDKTIEKYIGWLDKGNKFEKLFSIAILMPIAPDDFLCYLSGLTKMSLKKFTFIIILCKPLSIFLYSMGLATITHFVIGFVA